MIHCRECSKMLQQDSLRIVVVDPHVLVSVRISAGQNYNIHYCLDCFKRTAGEQFVKEAENNSTKTKPTTQNVNPYTEKFDIKFWQTYKEKFWEDTISQQQKKSDTMNKQFDEFLKKYPNPKIKL